MNHQQQVNGDESHGGDAPRKSPTSPKSSADSSLSTLSDSIARPAGTVDGSAFLKHLRAAGAFDPQDTSPQDTIGASEQRNDRQNLTQLSELFEASQARDITHMSNQDTIGASNRTNPRQNLGTLADLFAGPPPAPVQTPPPPPPPQPALETVSEASVSRSPTRPALKKSSFSPDGSPRNSSSDFPNQTAGFIPPTSRKPSQAAEGTEHHHSRAVSWGNNTTIPALSDQKPPAVQRAQSAQSEESFDSVSSLGADHRRTNTRTQYTLDDLITNGPYETEAETNIIRALEAQHSFRRPRADSSSLALSQPPESAAHDFMLDENDNSDTAFSAPARTTRDREKVPLINNTNANNRRHLNRQAHRRQLSVEQTLAGLTNAMTALHGSTGRAKAKAKYYQDEPFSSASAFANNATRLSEQQSENSNQTTGGRRASRVWRIEGLPIVQERPDSGATTDENDDEDDDVEDDDSEYISDSDDDQVDIDDIEAQVGASATATGGKKGRRRAGLGRKKKKKRRNNRNSVLGGATDKVKSEWEAFGAFFRPRKSHIATYIKNAILYVILPLMSVAAILFYFCGNPQTGLAKEGEPTGKASISWWLLFSVREVVTFSMALGMQGLLIDFLALGTRAMLTTVGPVITLLVVQSKGWPFICFWWAIIDLIMLWGDDSKFANHWGYWQNAIDLFNRSNPSGDIINSKTHTTLLKIAVSVSVLVAVKRFVIGLYLGRQTFTHYGQQLAKVMNSMLLVSEVASLAKDIERSRVDEDVNIPVHSEAFGFPPESIRDLAYPNDDNTVNTPQRSSVDASEKTSDKIIDTSCRDPLTGSLKASEKSKLMQLLGQWEEPSKAYDPRHFEIASISAVLRFRKALTFIKKRYPFSYAFGPAETREACIDSAQQVYQRLLMHTPSEQVLPFETIALLALIDEGLDQQKAKDLVKLFRPDREGALSMLDFVRSVDTVYKEFRMLQASIENSSQIDRAFENIFNVVFYVIVVTVTLSQLGFNPFALFLSLSSVILAFAFMIGSASSKYFEGLLFILVRRPYGIGDRIHISNVERDTSVEGCQGWVVENVTLFETICTWTPTKERCSLSNGSLASSRIINAARSHQAQFHVFLKFPIDTPYDKTLIFKTAIEEYMKVRPREWLALNAFRAQQIVANEGYMQYVIVIQHRESWQNIGQILESKANLSSYCNEVARQLNMHYRAPPLPVDLRYSQMPQVPMVSMEGTNFTHNASSDLAHFGGQAQTQGARGGEEEIMDREAHIQQFRQIAMNKHNIRC